MAYRLCNLPCQNSRGIRCGVNGADDGLAGYAGDSNTVQPQAAGTGRYPLPSDRPGGSTDDSILNPFALVVRVSVAGSGVVGGWGSFDNLRSIIGLVWTFSRK